jgi:putative SOS response-associated peptidase YedK
VIVTTRANDLLAPIHSRMPVMLDEADWDTWLDPTTGDVDALEAMLQPAPDDELEVYPVSPRVNSPDNNDPELIERVEPDTLL